ncbi:hypothetical protein KC19_3G134900 [Ceratodon purpureus]|uniref:Uncharacterized protein n=1 Tax=Ceratodon purpureus TaxID=3225 RepID=A0A8T0IJE9_CERPU|nr:hypothetical protein KC19_3G134900 [Ceratodon purpureus]
MMGKWGTHTTHKSARSLAAWQRRRRRRARLGQAMGITVRRTVQSRPHRTPPHTSSSSSLIMVAMATSHPPSPGPWPHGKPPNAPNSLSDARCSSTSSPTSLGRLISPSSLSRE